ncbi:hypothetical protein JB92DRAFT_2827158 [Gautieria morchelliformis]|nr:hypothetical protein JB92DRAFT_2827158 [Gautieria morchelliformis]
MLHPQPRRPPPAAPPTAASPSLAATPRPALELRARFRTAAAAPHSGSCCHARESRATHTHAPIRVPPAVPVPSPSPAHAPAPGLPPPVEDITVPPRRWTVPCFTSFRTPPPSPITAIARSYQRAGRAGSGGVSAQPIHPTKPDAETACGKTTVRGISAANPYTIDADPEPFISRSGNPLAPTATPPHPKMYKVCPHSLQKRHRVLDSKSPPSLPSISDVARHPITGCTLSAAMSSADCPSFATGEGNGGLGSVHRAARDKSDGSPGFLLTWATTATIVGNCRRCTRRRDISVCWSAAYAQRPFKRLHRYTSYEKEDISVMLQRAQSAKYK